MNFDSKCDKLSGEAGNSIKHTGYCALPDFCMRLRQLMAEMQWLMVHCFQIYKYIFHKNKYYKICNLIHIAYLIHIIFILLTGYPVSRLVKYPPEMQEDWVQSLRWDNPLENGMANSTLFQLWESSWQGLAGYSPQSHRVRHDWVTISTGIHTQIFFSPNQEHTESLVEIYGLLAYLKDVKDEQNEE